MMAMILLIRRSFWLDRQLRVGRWHATDPLRGEETIGRELGAMTVGIIGMGNIGSAVAHRVAAFGARILFADAVPRTNSDAIQVDLETVLRESDVVCVHAPLDVDTKALIGSEALSRMKKG